MLYFNILIWFLVSTGPAMAENLLDVTVTSVYDGDTIFVDIPYLPAVFGERLGVRLVGIDTPEMHGKCPQEKELAKAVKAFLESKVLGARRIDLLNVSRDKYFRVDAVVMADHDNLNQLLIDQHLAIPYFGGTKEQDWCRSGPVN